MRIVEHVRARLARQISAACADTTGQIPTLMLGPRWEEAFAGALVGTGDDRQLTMAPSLLQQFVRELAETLEALAMRGEMPVLVTTPTVRPYVRAVVERVRPTTMVLSQNEIHARAKLRHLGEL
jgi:flagellar biosynthesis protein FlhA